MSKRNTLVGLVSAFVLLQANPVLAQDQIVKQVQFAKGTNGSVIKDKIKGDQYIDYKLVAKAGQTMTVDLKTSNSSSYFNILKPGSSDEAFFIGSNEGNHYSGALPANGEYTIRVYMMRNAARRNEVANYTLNVAINGSAAKPAAQSSHDAKVAGTNYHATGNIPCKIAGKAAECAFGVERLGHGEALVTVTRPDQVSRVIYFGKGKASWSDQSQAEKNVKFKSSKKADNNLIAIGNENYEIPDAVIFGG